MQMTRRITILGMILATAILLLPASVHADNDSTRIYTQDQPLVFEDAWDLGPYSFLDENNDPAGFNVDLVRTLMEEMKIPYVIRLKSRKAVLADITNGRADLTLGMMALFHDKYGYYGKTVIHMFTHSVATPKGKPIVIRKVEDLANNDVIVHKNSYSYHLMQDNGWGAHAEESEDMEASLQYLSKTQKGQIVWNTASLKWLIHITHTDNVQLTPIDMPHGEYKFISKDSILLSRLDSCYAQLKLTEEIDRISTHWFYPELEETGLPFWIWYITAGILFAVLVLIVYNARYHSLERKYTELAQTRNKRLAHVLQTCSVRIWTYDVATQVFTWTDRNGQPIKQYTSLEFARRYHPEDFRKLGEGMRLLIDGIEEQVTVELSTTDEESANSSEMRDYSIVLSVLRKKHGKPVTLIGTKIDVTEEHKRQLKTKERLMHYQSIFNSAMVDMVYYDADGLVSRMNDRACQTFGMTAEEMRATRIDLNRSVNEPTFDFRNFDLFHATTFLKRNGKMMQAESEKSQDDVEMYYELQLEPLYNKEKKLEGIFGTGRDVTEVARTYQHIQQGIQQVQKATNEVREYVENMNYVLGVGGVRMAQYSPDTHTLTIYKGLNEVQLALTQTRCMTLIDEKSKKSAMRTLNSMDNHTNHDIDMEIRTTIRRKGNPLYLQFRFIPTYDDHGAVKDYFGLCRDVSEIKATNHLLEKETERAKEMEMLKNSFLRNMSYEIRTPLNAVVGFAELLEMNPQSSDEKLFIDEIKQNSAHLLQLINDILFLSRLDAHMIEFNKQPVDFAMTFEGHYQMGWAHDMKDSVNYIVENHYEQLVVEIDDANLGRIIEQIAANAAQHTHSGTVRARYDYINGKLMIAIDDTGNGMSPEKLSQIYERFSSGNHTGTGLGLPICKELAEQMGGSIDINSEEGKGTTVWITIPCTAQAMERKKQL